MEQNRSFDIPVYVIVLTFIFCWPIGVFLLILKSRNLKIQPESKISILQKKQQKYQTTAIIFLIITLVFVSVSIFDEDAIDMAERIGDALLGLVLFGVPTYIYYTKAKKVKKTIDKLMIYNDFVVIRNITSIKKLSEKLNVSEEHVLRFVSEMIRQNQIDAYIKDDKEIILTNVNRKTQSIKCTNCGAENPYIENRENICEYCGSVLKK